MTTYIIRDGKMKLEVPKIPESHKVISQMQENIQNIKDETFIKLLKKQINETCQEIENLDNCSSYKVHYICKKLHTILGTLASYTKVIRRGCLYFPLILSTIPLHQVLAADSAEKIRHSFDTLINVATAVAEPILWFYALTALIMMATGRNKTIGWTRLKNVGYSYVGIIMLPTIFAFLRWIATVLRGAFSQF